MTYSVESPEALSNQLTEEELDGVSGGMKWEPGTKNPDLIDARGGQIKVFGWTITLDANGKPSSATFG
jgi:hypothetical protein